jgi:hypothetical protein
MSAQVTRVARLYQSLKVRTLGLAVFVLSEPRIMQLLC